MSKIKNGGLDQYGAELFERQQFGTVGVEGVKLFDAVFVSRISAPTWTNTSNEYIISIRRSLRGSFAFTRLTGTDESACVPVCSAAHTQVGYVPVLLIAVQIILGI